MSNSKFTKPLPAAQRKWGIQMRGGLFSFFAALLIISLFQQWHIMPLFGICTGLTGLDFILFFSTTRTKS